MRARASGVRALTSSTIVKGRSMSIAVGVACPEGLVLAADSRTSVFRQNQFRIATDSATKLFEVGLDLERIYASPFAVATCGWASLLGKTIAGHMEEFDAITPDPATVQDAAAAIAGYFGERFKEHIEAGNDEAPPEGVDALFFLVAGYDDQGVGHIFEVRVPSGTITSCCATNSTGAAWRGEMEAMTRLLKGYDHLRLPAPGEDEAGAAINGVEYLVPFERFALQDAVDFSAYVVRTTIDTQRFTDGVRVVPMSSPTCGGDIQIVAITARSGVEWLRRATLRGDLRAGRAEGALE